MESEVCLESACAKVPNRAAVLVKPTKDTLTFTDKQSTYNIGPVQPLDMKPEIIIISQTLHLKGGTEVFYLPFFLQSYN